MNTRRQIIYTEAQLQGAVNTGIDVSLQDLIIYDLRAQASYVLLDSGNQPLDGGVTVLDEAQFIASNIDGRVEGQLSADAVRVMLARVVNTTGAESVQVTVVTALQPTFETAKLDENFTKEALEEEFKKRDLQDLATPAAGELEPGSVGSAQLKDRAVTTPKLAAGSVTSDKVGAGAVKSFHIADKAVTSRKLAVGAISGSKLEANSVGADKVRDGSITLDKLAPDARAATGVQTRDTPRFDNRRQGSRGLY